MTPEERQLRDSWMAEMWVSVPEHRRISGADAWTSTAASEGFASCVVCGVVFRQPKTLRQVYRWCPECAREVVA